MRKDQETGMYLWCGVLIAISFFAMIVLHSSDQGLTGLVTAPINVSVLPNASGVIQNVPAKTVLDALMRADEVYAEMQWSNVSTFFFSDTLLKAQRLFIGGEGVNVSAIVKTDDPIQRAYLKRLQDVANATPAYEVLAMNWSEAVRLSNVIIARKQQAAAIIDSIALLEDKEKLYAKRGVNTTQGGMAIGAARRAFREERFDEALMKIDESDTLLELANAEATRFRALVTLGKGFIARYGVYILIGLLILSVIAVPASKKVQQGYAAQKLEMMKKELKALEGLMGRMQSEYFISKSIPKSTFSIREERYQSKIAKLKRTIPMYEAWSSGKKLKEEQKARGILELK